MLLQVWILSDVASVGSNKTHPTLPLSPQIRLHLLLHKGEHNTKLALLVYANMDTLGKLSQSTTAENLPVMLTVESVVATAPRRVTDGFVLWANRCIPPKAVVPEIALVTAIRGE